jgi:8-oxo-dGTP pyrophosphatase MutT (NUDIX family)
MKTVQAVGAVVYRGAPSGAIEVLLIRKQKGSWSLPKGKINRGEDSIDALLREIAEETGITGEVEDLIGEVRYRIAKPNGPRTKNVVYYLVRATGGKPRPDRGEKIVRVRWTPVPLALRRLRRDRLLTLLRAALTLLSPIPDHSGRQ